MNYNNLAEKTNFIAGSSAFEHIPFFLSSVNLPEISIDHPEISGGRFSHSIKLPGDTIKYGIVSFEMLIDEELLIYDELYKLVQKNTNPETNTFGDFTFDFFIEVNDNKGHSVLTFHFDNCRISNISGLLLDSSDDSTYHKLNIDLSYDRFYPVRKRKFNLTGEYDVIKKRKPKEFTNEWIDMFDLDLFLLWGLPKPQMINNAEMEMVISMIHSRDSNHKSGIISSESFDPRKPMEFEVEFDLDGSEGTLEFGVTEGAGIDSTVNGRTGKSLFDISPNTEVYNIKYIPRGPEVDLIINDESYVLVPSNHSEMFLFFQGFEGTNIKSIKYRLD